MHRGEGCARLRPVVRLVFERADARSQVGVHPIASSRPVECALNTRISQRSETFLASPLKKASITLWPHSNEFRGPSRSNGKISTSTEA